MAYWHQPTFSATTAASSTTPDPSAPGIGSAEGAAADAWWKLLYRARATLVLNGHEHVYARFRPMDPEGRVDTGHGIRQFTIGTGGEDLDVVALASAAYANPNVVTANDSAFGALKLSLGDGRYSWHYTPVLAGPGFTGSATDYSDDGSATCHG